MKALVVYAHPNPKSFNHAILETTVETLKAGGHEVRVRDLYEQGFDPVLKGSDFVAMQSGQLPADITAEQAEITWADVLVFVYPIWWTGLPAMMKGYIDRVYLNGFAYEFTADGVKALLKGKKAFLINTSGTPTEMYDANGMSAAMRKTSDLGILGFCGVEVIDHLFFGGVPAVDDATRKGYLEKVKAAVSGI